MPNARQVRPGRSSVEWRYKHVVYRPIGRGAFGGPRNRGAGGVAAFACKYVGDTVRRNVDVTLARARVVMVRAEVHGLFDYSFTNDAIP
jgi:hypothetical protein